MKKLNCDLAPLIVVKKTTRFWKTEVERKPNQRKKMTDARVEKKEKEVQSCKKLFR